MVVALPSRAFEDFSDDTQARIAVTGDFDSFLNFGFGGGLVGVDSWFFLIAEEGLRFLRIALGDECLFGFVWVDQTGFLAVCFRDVVLGRRGRDAEEAVEVCGWTFGTFNFVFEPEDLVV